MRRYGLGLTPSTIAFNARLALQALGATEKPSKVDPLLILAARAERCQDPGANGALSFFTHAGEQLRVISVNRPEPTLVGVLSPAELAVARAMFEGLCHREMASRRGTSLRTVADQIAAVFRRVGVSGRNELLLRVFSGSLAFDTASSANLRSSESRPISLTPQSRPC